MTRPHFPAGLLLLSTFLLFQGSPITTDARTQTTISESSSERNQAIELYKQGKDKDASDLLKRILKKNKSDDEAWYFLGLTLLRQRKDLKDATKAFESALKFRPNSSASHTGLSYSLLLRSKLPEAVREARAALKLDPNILAAHYIVGAARLRMGDRAEALKEAETAIKIDAAFAPAYLLKSQALATFFTDGTSLVQEPESPADRRGRYARAAEALEKFLTLDPNAEDKETWVEQLESLRFHGQAFKPNEPSNIFSAREVTTKARVLKKPEPAYTDEARANQVSGIVILRAVLASDGTVKHILILQGLPDGLTEAALRSARGIKFVPATLDGRPVSMAVQLEYNFNTY